MNPEPAAHVQSVFAVPEGVHAVTLGGGCGETHFPVNGAVDCARCAGVVTEYTFASHAAAVEASSPEQQNASADAPEASVPVEAAAPAAADSPAAVADPPSRAKRTPDPSA